MRTGDDEVLGGARATRQRRAVLDVLEELGVFASVQVIYDELNRIGQHVGRSTVYRSLQLLAETGSVDCVRGLDGETLYRRCAAGPHHHLVCRRCRTAVEVVGESIDSMVAGWAREAGFTEIESVIEIFGFCPTCS
ncbi:Fur family transcriptional regulator [Nocardioides sp. NPDC057772]|uniref:Fur family transcriptional regulator n=1 Tax=Nocardioides sp. NPDC057772 TaxID=3346245 RepID=UPI00366E33A4